MIFGFLAKTDKRRLMTAVIIMACAVVVGLILTLVLLATRQNVRIGDKTVQRSIGGEDDAKQVMRDLGFEPENGEPVVRHVSIPEEFDEVYTAYNELQQKSGFDLYPFRGKPTVLYCCPVRGTDGGCSEIVTLVVCGGRLIGGDISDEKAGGKLNSLAEK